MALPVNEVLVGDCRDVFQTLPEESVHCVVTSPPYWGLRDYGVAPSAWGGDPACAHAWGRQERGRRKDVLPAEESEAGRLGLDDRSSGGSDGGRFCQGCGAWLGQLGLEPTLDLYVEHLVGIFRQVRRVLRDDGTVWLNLGDSYVSNAAHTAWDHGFKRRNGGAVAPTGSAAPARAPNATGGRASGLKPKDLVGIPWRVAFALQADGWWLRSDIIWSKPNPMPESVQDRPTKAHEYVFLLAKSARYFYDAEAIREPHKAASIARYEYGLRLKADPLAIKGSLHDRVQAGIGQSERMGDFINEAGRNKRSVWTVASQPYAEAHFATFPPDLVKPCILAGTSEAGCCEACGAPRERITEKRATGRVRQRSTGGLGTEIRRAPQGLAPVGGTFQEGVVVDTVGWQPTCDCDAEAAPCTVLDPFCGSGTVGQVAEAHGRRWVGIDVNPEYGKLARERTAQAGLPMLAR